MLDIRFLRPAGLQRKPEAGYPGLLQILADDARQC